MKEAYMILRSVDIVLVIKVEKIVGVRLIFMFHYVEKVLLKFNHLKFKEANTPYDSSTKILKS